MKKILLFVLFFAFFHNAEAQAIPSLVISSLPEYPKAFEQVTVSFSNFETNVNEVEISWIKNGVVVEKGIGDTSFTFTTGNWGTRDVITVSAETFTKSLTITPSKVDILWQANTYTPPFYRGKALYSNESLAEFVAVPRMYSANGTPLDPKQLVYTWSRNGTILGDLSGYGKNKLQNSSGVLFKPFTIDVKVSTPDGSQVSLGSITLGHTQPVARIYEDHPLYGVLFNTTVPDTFTLKNQEISLFAAPFFFDNRNIANGELSINWSLNNQVITADDTPRTLTLRKPEELSGKANLSLSISSTQKLMQFAKKNFSIAFGTDNSL